MSVKKDESGRRWIEVEVEVPGTPEQVWEAIATGEGVSSWFVPVEVEKDEKGNPVRVISHMGPGMDSVATPTAWEPPRRFAAEGEMGPNAPILATEWIVEARSGSTCMVRVVHSLFASSDDWDDQLESFESGWPGFLAILRLYLTYFRGQPCSAFRLMGAAAVPEPVAWRAAEDALGITGAGLGQQLKTADGAPPLSGVVERVGEGKHPCILLLRLDEPAEGIAAIGAHTMRGEVLFMISVYLYGERAPEAAAQAEPSWRAWTAAHFPMSG